MTPFYCLAIRFILAFLIIMLFYGRRFMKLMRREFWAPSILIAICTAFAFAASVCSLLYTSATVAGFLMGTAVIFTPFLAYFILGAHFQKRHLLPIMIVVSGLYFLCLSGNGEISFGAGEVLALLSSVASAAMLAYSSKFLDRIPNTVVTVMQCGVTGILCLLAALLFEPFPGLTGIPPFGWFVIIYLAIGCSIVAYLCQNAALSHIPATYVALLFCSEPLFTAIFSNLLLGETLRGSGFLGALLIMVSIVIASLLPVEPSPVPRPGQPITLFRRRADKAPTKS